MIKDVIAAGDPSGHHEPSRNAIPVAASSRPGNSILPIRSRLAPGRTIEVAPGILWARLSLPFLLDHVNIYFVDDGDGWALIDTGLGDEATKAAWQPLLDTVLTHRPLTRIIATHFHPDHVGAAGFLLEHFNVPLYMSATEYLQSLILHLDPGALEAEHYRRFYLDHGLDAKTTQSVVTGGHAYLNCCRDCRRPTTGSSPATCCVSADAISTYSPAADIRPKRS